MRNFKPAFGDTLQELAQQNTPAKESVRQYRKKTDKIPANYITARQLDINIAEKA